MFKSILARYYFATLVTIIFCFTMLGLTLLVLTTQYSIDQQQNRLYQNAKDLLPIVSGIMDEPFDDFQKEKPELIGNVRMLKNIVGLISEGGSKEVIVVNAPENDCLWVTSGSVTYYAKLFDNDILENTASRGLVSTNNRLAGIYPQNRYSVGIPIYEESDPSLLKGYIFVSSPATAFTKSITVIFRYFLFSLCGVLALSILLVKIASREIIRPMKEMRESLMEYAQGNFSKRVHVVGHNEISELCASFNHMADALDQLESSRRGFMASVSHDLKTPLTSIGGFIDGMLDGTIPLSRHSEYLERISLETKRLNRMVNSILDITRLEAGQISPKIAVFNINETITRALLSFEKALEDNKVDVAFDLDKKLMVSADEDMISRVLVNIIGNSVKFTPVGGYLRVTAGEEEKNVIVKIRNSGKGIPEDDIPFIFDRFYKADKSRGIDKQGAGLGLYIAKMLLNLNNGEISVVSFPDEYTEFSFVLPAAPSEDSKFKIWPRKVMPEKGEKS